MSTYDATNDVWIDEKTINGRYRLVMTSFICPEQYDAYWGDKRIGYLRLRHGRFSVECPYCGGEEVFSAYPEGDGRFENDERAKFLGQACDAIDKWRKANRGRYASDRKR